MLKYRNNKIPREHRGFTMVELLVTVSIFVLITTTILANYPRFGSRINLENTAHQIALSVREAQTYGLSVKEFDTNTNDKFPGYGIYFPSPGNDSKSFTIFADINGDKKYDISGCGISGDECLKKFTIKSSEWVYALCGNLKKDNVPKFNKISDLNATNCDGSIAAWNITFTRPDPDATLTAYLGGSNYDASYSDAEIIVTNQRGDVRTIVVWLTGQISVE